MSENVTNLPSWVTRINTSLDTYNGVHTFMVIGFGNDGKAVLLSSTTLPAPKPDKPVSKRPYDYSRLGGEHYISCSPFDVEPAERGMDYVKDLLLSTRRGDWS